MKQHLLIGAAAVLAMVTTGCNGLTGADRFGTDDQEIGDGGEDTKVVSRAPASKPLSCAYPTEGQTGVDVGNLVSSSIAYETTLHPFEDMPRPLRISDLYDCDGSKGVDAIIVITAKYF